MVLQALSGYCSKEGIVYEEVKMNQEQVQKRFNDAVSTITEYLKEDVSVIAVILYGSLSYDKVWEKSDIDLKAIVRDQKLNARSYCLNQDGIVVNLDLMTRSDFIKATNASIGGQWSHSYFSKGKILYTSDESLHDIIQDLQVVGTSDMEYAAFEIAASIIGYMQKAEKWLVIKQDPMYSRYYLLKLVNEIACLEVCLHQEDPSREAILRAAELNPGLMDRFYQYPMNNSLSEKQIMELLKEADTYLESHLNVIRKPVIEYLSDGEPKTMTMLTKYFRTDGHYIVEVMDYLCEKGILDKVSQTIRVTPKGRQVVEEIAYIYVNR